MMIIRMFSTALCLALLLLAVGGSARAQTTTCVDNFAAIQNLINQDIVSGVAGGIKATTVNSLMTIQNSCYLNVESYNSAALTALGIAPNTTGGLATWPVSGGGGIPGGSSGQLQYNNAGSFGGFTAGGDLTFSQPNFTLNTVNSNVGAFGSSTQCPTITVNEKGLVTAASQTACTGVGILFFPVTVFGTTTSGGVPYFSSTISLASSGLLTANALMIGGGAGAAPATTTTGAGVLTALGIATNGASGFPLVNSTVPTVGHCLQWGSTGITDAGGSCTTGGGGGTVSSGNSGALTYYAATGTTVSGTATTNASISGAALSLGSSGVSGSIIFGGYTSGTVTLEPVTAALGSAIAFLPANTGQIAELNLAQTWSAAQTFGASDIVLTGASGCATFSAGVLSGTGSACSGGGAVSSVANSDGTLTISPTTGAVVASLALGHANTWTGAQTYTNGDLLLKGSSSGAMTLEAPAAASTYVMTFPAATDTVAALGVANAFTGNNSHSGVEAFTGALKVATRVVSASTDTASATTDYFLCVSYTSTGAVTETLPSSPPTGLTLLIKDCGGAAATHNITITPAAGNIDGASTYVMSTNYGSVAVTYANSTWNIN